MARLTPQEFQQKHAERLKNAIGDMQKGIEKVSESPTAAAATKQAKMLANLTKAVQSGVWANALRKVTLTEWKEKMITKGLPRVAGGIDAAAPKVIDFASQVLPYIDTLSAKVDGMPDLTLEDNINRMSTFVRGMAQFQKK